MTPEPEHKSLEVEQLEEEYIAKMVEHFETSPEQEKMGLIGGPGTTAAYIAHKLVLKGVDVTKLTDHARASAIAKGIKIE